MSGRIPKMHDAERKGCTGFPREAIATKLVRQRPDGQFGLPVPRRTSLIRLAAVAAEVPK